MFLMKQLCKQNTILFIAVELPLPWFPLVISRTVDSHNLTQKVYWILYFEFFENFVVFPLPVTYSLFALAPSTQYPFFNRAISTSCLAMLRRSRSNSLSDILVCSAAFGLPFFGSSASSPSSRYRFTRRIPDYAPRRIASRFPWLKYARPSAAGSSAAFPLCSSSDSAYPFSPFFLPPFLHLLYLTTKKVDTHTFYECLLSFYRCSFSVGWLGFCCDLWLCLCKET